LKQAESLSRLVDQGNIMLAEIDRWNALSHQIIGCCLAVHRRLGPGLLESVYDDSVAEEFTIRGIEFQRQLPVPVKYFGKVVGTPLRLDFLIGDTVVLEIKAIESLQRVHSAQILTYLKLTAKPLGLLINFNVPQLREGIRRIIHTAPFLSSTSPIPPQ
jgi:GxxExxY protein